MDDYKIANVVLYIRSKGVNHYPKILLVMYFAEVKHAVRYGRYIACELYKPYANMAMPYFFTDQYTINLDMDELSQSDVECLDESIEFCKDKTIGELSNLTFTRAWKTAYDNKAEFIDKYELAYDWGATKGDIKHMKETDAIWKALT